MEFEKAGGNDYKVSYHLIEKRIEWMNIKGIRHWNVYDYLNVYPLSHYQSLQEKGELFVLKDDGRIVCTGALLNDDPRWTNKQSAYYIHHLTAEVSDKHYGQIFINKAIIYTLENKRQYLRLDSSVNYPKLEEYYSKLGFRECGECVDGDYKGILRQLDLHDKKSLRKYIKSMELDDEYINRASLEIENRVISSDKYKKAQSIFVYLSSDNEVKTNMIMMEALKDHKKVYVPRCYNDEMKAVLIDENSKYFINSYGIKEPMDDSSIADNSDLVIVPCISAGRDLSRLGHGKGFYDRYLKDHPSYKMVLCFKRKILPAIPMDENDVRMDEIVSENI